MRNKAKTAAGRCKVIARLWHGETAAADGDSYEQFLKERAAPDYASADGLQALHFLRREEGGSSHFLLITLWESEESMASFAGTDYRKAKYYPEDDDFLREKEEAVELYQVFFSGR